MEHTIRRRRAALEPSEVERAMRSLALFAILAGFAGLCSVRAATHLVHHPTMNRTTIVFSYAGDLWTVPREGGSAVRLTVGAGIESDPVFSPDGETIAFTGEYDGNVDVYTVPVEGGVPKRLTFHSAPDTPVGWTPDGSKILFHSSRSCLRRCTNLFVVGTEGGLPEMLPLPLAFTGSYSPDGKSLAYAPLDGAQFLRTPERWVAWKRYRGGTASYLWVIDLASLEVEKIPRTDSNDINPMWIGDKIYLLSDRNGTMSLFRYDGDGKAPIQAIADPGADLRSAKAGPGGIVYEQFGKISIFDLASGKSRPVGIEIAADLSEVRPRIENVSDEIEGAGISPTGVRAVFEAHGEILTVPAEKGDVRNLTRTPGVMERTPAWSPDGQWIAYFSDENREYALHVRAQTGEGVEKKIPLTGRSAFYAAPQWSPDSKHIAFRDNQLGIWRLEISTGALTRIDSEPYYRRWLSELEPVSWSPDSKWIAYNRQLKNQLSALFLHSVTSGKGMQVTDGMNDARYPVFDREGNYLYFASSTNFGMRTFGLDMTGDEHEVTRAVYALVLASDGQSPVAPESDEEEQKAQAADEKEDAKAAGPPVVRVDMDGMASRMVALPIPVRRWSGLACAKDGSLLLLEGPGVMAQMRGDEPSVLHRYDLKRRKLEQLTDRVEQYHLSADGAKLLLGLKRGGAGDAGPAGPTRWLIADALSPIKPEQADLNISAMEIQVDPRAEWKQMFREVWRMQRSFFYDENLHGLDAEAYEEKYATYVESVTSRDDLNYIFQEMLAPMTAGHLRGGGGTVPRGKPVKVGLLGADFEISNGRYRFKRIYTGDAWTPDLKAPLGGPGIDVKEGDYLLAVDGQELAGADNVYALLAGAVGRQVTLRVSIAPDGSNSREARVRPVDDENLLRRYAWMNENRRKVEELSGGKLGYVYLPDTAFGGLTYFNRYFFAQLDKEGMILDERYNSGGQAADYIIEVLNRPVYGWSAFRTALPRKTPSGSNQGPKVMIVNELAGSGGDLMPWMFRYAKTGPLVGKRTWGGLIGVPGYPKLMDGGTVTAPSFRLYSNEGEWVAENTGVAPDFEVELDPKMLAAGHDTQLERAVAIAMEALKRNPPVEPKHPPYPNYSGEKD